MFEKLREAIQEAVERHRHRPFLEAAMAACAYVAMADGSISIGERGRVDDILEHLDQLRIFDPHEGVDLMNDFADGLREDPVKGKKAVMKAVAEMSDDPEAAYLVARMCIAISNADADFSPEERQAVIEVIDVLKASDRVTI